MKSSRMMWVLVTLVVLTTMAVTFGTGDSRSQEKAKVQTQQTETPGKSNPIEDLKQSYPSVDYFDSRMVDSVRQKRSEKYGKYPVLNPDITKNDQETSFLDWASELAALPVKESEIIVIGKVIDARAYLSGNKKSVYSEFTFEIEKQFKNTSQQFSSADKSLKAEREGGIVRYPSGFETFYFVSGQRMPKISKRYLLFLTNQFPLYGFRKNDLYLLTAYELSDGKIKPLDNPDGGTHKIATFYKDKDEKVLLEDLSNVIN